MTEQNPNHVIKKITNNNMCVKIGNEMGMSLVGIGGVDIANGQK